MISFFSMETDAANVATEETKVETTESSEDRSPVVKKQVEKKEPALKLATYFEDAKIVCACGNTFTTGSTKKDIHVELCSNCHPFYTGQEKFVDTEGRVERFQRMNDAKRDAKPKKEAEKKDNQPKTLKEMLAAIDNQ